MARAKQSKAKERKDEMPAPEASDRDVAEFWETHSVADYWDDLKPAKLTKRPAPRQVVTLRFDPQALVALRAIAHGQGMNYTALVRGWIGERLKAELRAKVDLKRKSGSAMGGGRDSKG
jgi:CopG antitoxin of type II toxin-antitoxin system